MARRNKGVFEPEMRLLLMIPYAVLVIAGCALYSPSDSSGSSRWLTRNFLFADVGWAVSYRNHDHWMVPVIMYGFVNAGQSEFPPRCLPDKRPLAASRTLLH